VTEPIQTAYTKNQQQQNQTYCITLYDNMKLHITKGAFWIRRQRVRYEGSGNFRLRRYS